jgi:DNA polymerase-3 subunit delta'
MFKKIKGQDRVIEMLEKAIEGRRVAQAYLFSGPKGVGKFTTALYFAMALNCRNEKKRRPCGECASCKKFLHFNHLDFSYLFPIPNMELKDDGTVGNPKFLKEYEAYLTNKKETPWKEFFFTTNSEIRRDSIRVLQNRLGMGTHEAIYRVCILEDADSMNNNTANAFLKTLEEPPANTVIILTTTQPERLLPTILSRCQEIHFHPINKSIIQEILQTEFMADANLASSLAKLVNGNLELAISLLDKSDSEARELAFKIVELIGLEKEEEFLNLLGTFKTGRNSAFMVELIANLSLLLSDVIMLKNHPEEVVIPANEEIYQKYYMINPSADDILIDVVPQLESMNQQARGKVNPQLIVIEIYNRITRRLYQG